MIETEQQPSTNATPGNSSASRLRPFIQLMQSAVANEFVFNCQLIFNFHCYHFHINYSLKGFLETFLEHPFVKKKIPRGACP